MGVLSWIVRDDKAQPPWAIVQTPLFSVGRHTMTFATAFTTILMLVFLWGFNRTYGLVS